MRRPKVGETLYALNTRRQVLKPVVVTKVGRKYFTADSQRFHLSTWRSYSVNTMLYESKQAWKDEMEIRIMCGHIHDAFEHGCNWEDLSSETLRRIYNLLFEESAE